MLSPKNKRIVIQIIPYGIISMLFSMAFVMVEKGILGDSPTYPSTGNPYNFNFFPSVIMSMFFGFSIGLLEIFYINKRFENHRFITKISSKILIYLALTTVFTVLVTSITNSIELGTHPFDNRVTERALSFISSFAFWTVVLYVSLAVGFCILFAEISDNIGLGVLVNFFVGKYHSSKIEDRIFMLLDMKSSTTIAEKLGHEKYFVLLKRYYSDITQPIIDYDGEIYQYAGDEVVITWKVKDGSSALKCIQCFFAMKKSLEDRATSYELDFGVAPAFKAGIHLGQVTTGEIGVIKKEITFSGDVLNTAARIQGLCNGFGVNLLISDKLASTLKSQKEFDLKALGDTELRGKNEKIELFTIVN